MPSDSKMRQTPRAVVFDLDGVLVDTSRLHAAAWKATFDELLGSLGDSREFDIVDDYHRHVDGLPRYRGVEAFLASRDIELPWGDRKDPPGLETICAVGNLKNEAFHELVDTEGTNPQPGVVDLLEGLSAAGVPIAVVSSSRNARLVIPEEVSRHVNLMFDGTDRAELGLPGKPAPDMFVEAARRMGADPRAAAVVEDAPSGAEAGRRGGFSVVVGVGDDVRDQLLRAGADFVVGGTGDLPIDVHRWANLLPQPLDAITSAGRIVEDLRGRPAIFLDYDGTLTPIVADPDLANIGDRERGILGALVGRAPLAIISGRGLSDVHDHVAVEGLTYSGSHGWEIATVDGNTYDHERASEFLGDLDMADGMLQDETASLDGIHVERKRFAIAVHTRRAGSQAARVSAGAAARRVVERFERLRLSEGKEVFELRPDVEWDKGRALAHLLETMPGDPCPLYIGDDTTDEDAFVEVRIRGGIAIRVGEPVPPIETWATYRIPSPKETSVFLERLAGALTPLPS